MEQDNMKQTIMSRGEFNKSEEQWETAFKIKLCGIALYVLAVINILLSLTSGAVLNILDSILIIGIGIWLHIRKNRAPAIVMCCYSLINTIYMLVATGFPTGALYVIVALFAVVYTFRLNSAYKRYVNSQNKLQK